MKVERSFLGHLWHLKDVFVCSSTIIIDYNFAHFPGKYQKCFFFFLKKKSLKFSEVYINLNYTILL